MRKLNKTLDPKYIVSFIFRFSAVTFIGFGVFGLGILIFLNREIGPTYSEGVSTLSSIHNHLPSIIFATAISQALTLCLIAMIMALLWSHSIAGPLLRLRRHLKEISQGKFLEKPVVFRNTDQLHDLAEAFSEMTLTHSENSAKALSLLVRAQKVLDDCLALKDKEKELNPKLKELKSIYSHIKDIYATQSASNEKTDNTAATA